MTFRLKALSAIAFILGTVCAQAAPTASVSVFATGVAVNATQPDSITTGGNSVWVEYGNGAVSTGGTGSSTVVQYGLSGAVLNTYTVPGLVDGLKFDPNTGMVWALQNNDGNATLSIINPATKTVSAPLSYAAPPYVYGANSARGYDDVAFLNGKVFISYTNPVNPTDPVVQILNQGNTPAGTLTTTSIVTAAQTNPAFTNPSQAPPDVDSLKTTPNGQLILTSEGDGLGSQFASSDGRYTLISSPGTPQQALTNIRVTNAAGVNVNKMDDILFPGTTTGTLFVADTNANTVYAIVLSGLDPNTPIASLGSFNEVGLVNPTTGVVESALLSNLQAPHGMAFIANSTAVPEPQVWALLLLGFVTLATAGTFRRKPTAAAAV